MLMGEHNPSTAATGIAESRALFSRVANQDLELVPFSACNPEVCMPGWNPTDNIDARLFDLRNAPLSHSPGKLLSGPVGILPFESLSCSKDSVKFQGPWV